MIGIIPLRARLSGFTKYAERVRCNCVCRLRMDGPVWHLLRVLSLCSMAGIFRLFGLRALVRNCIRDSCFIAGTEHWTIIYVLPESLPRCWGFTVGF